MIKNLFLPRLCHPAPACGTQPADKSVSQAARSDNSPLYRANAAPL